MKCEFVEYMMPLIINVGTILLLAILGLVLRAGKGAFLIAGYNAASKEEKEKKSGLRKKSFERCWH